MEIQDNTNPASPNKTITTKAIIGLVGVAIVLIAALLAYQFLKGGTANNVINNQWDTKTAEAKNELVNNFPDFPIYPEAKVINSRMLSDTQNQYFEAFFESDKSVTEVRSWYVQELKKDGWKLVTEESNRTMNESTAVYKKGNSKVGLSVENENQGETEITIYLTVKR